MVNDNIMAPSVTGIEVRLVPHSSCTSAHMQIDGSYGKRHHIVNTLIERVV